MSIEGKHLYGREMIFTTAEVITARNVVDVLRNALAIHEKNAREIDFLYDFYRGKHPIERRTKDIRPEINNKIAVNRANEIVTFKSGYFLGEPIQYVAHGVEDDKAESIASINSYMVSEDKESKDFELANWMHIAGTGYRMVLPDEMANNDDDESPFNVYTLDPRNTFVIYSNDVGHKPVMGVTFTKRAEDEKRIFTCYTENRTFKILDANSIMESKPHFIGSIPIIEYPLNISRIGAFEVVLDLLMAIDQTTSDRINGIEQFIQSLLVITGSDLNREDAVQIASGGMILLPPDAAAKYINGEMNQNQTQVVIDDMYDTVLTICGMPNRNGGSSTSDTGSAVIYRDGWSSAEGRAKETEKYFTASERKFLKIALRIADKLRNKPLKLKDVEIVFTRHNYSDMATKVNVLTTLLNNDKVHPKYAFELSGAFIDANDAYVQSMDYAEQREKEILAELQTSKVKADADTAQ